MGGHAEQPQAASSTFSPPRPASRRPTSSCRRCGPAGRSSSEHRLAPAPDVAEDDAARCRAELALAAAAVRASEADGGRAAARRRARRARDPRAHAPAARRAGARLGRGLGPHRAPRPVSRFGCPGGEPSRPYWHVAFLEREQPRLLEILYEINRRHLDEVEAHWPGDGGRRRRLSLFREGEGRRLRLGQLAILGSSHVSVAPPWEGPAAEILADFAVLRGRALEPRATPRLRAPLRSTTANPPLAELLAQTLGGGWARRPAALRAARDARVRVAVPRGLSQGPPREPRAAGRVPSRGGGRRARSGLARGREARPVRRAGAAAAERARAGARAPAARRGRLDAAFAAHRGAGPPRREAPGRTTGCSSCCRPWPTRSTATSACARRCASPCCRAATPRPCACSWRGRTSPTSRAPRARAPPGRARSASRRAAP